MNIHPKLGTSILNAAQQLGSTATTVRGAAKYILAHRTEYRVKRDTITPRVDLVGRRAVHLAIDRAAIGSTVEMTGYRTGYNRVVLPDAAAASRSREAAQRNNPRKKNLYIGVAKLDGRAHQERETSIHYKGSYKGYTGSEIHADYQSCLCASVSGKSAAIITECVLVRRILAPRDLRFRKDANGIFVQRMSDNMDFHPTPDIWRAKDFWTRVRAGFAENFKRRIESRKVESETKRVQAIYDRQIKSTSVTLEDSRRAGNCVEGSLRYCETRLRIPRETILAAGYLFSVPATKLLSVNGDPGVARAVRAAWMRETTVSI